MADDTQVVRDIDWREVFPFTHVFRAFRIAIHPSKLLLALVALLMLYIGGRVLDAIWPVHDRAVQGEVTLYEAFSKTAKPGQSFSDLRDAARKGVEAQYANTLLRYQVVKDQTAADNAAHDADLLAKVKDKILAERGTAVQNAQKAHAEALKFPAGVKEADKAKLTKQADDELERTKLAAYRNAYNEYQLAKTVKNHGLFDTFFEYETNQVANVVRGVRNWNWVGEERFDELADPRARIAEGNNPLAEQAANAFGASGFGAPGVIQSVVRFFAIGPMWLLSQHAVFAILFGILFLALWAVFGGAISRIAAVHVARDEKMSIRSALLFSVNKFLSFLFAPVIPLIILLFVGLLLTLASLLGNIPFFGPIIVGLFFFLALAGGFVMALVLLGLIGGFNLMYPTIAVEGSDSFDAISRSFSYLYARPWRLALYSVAAIVYGALTYLFVRMFIYMMLVLAHKFVGAGIFLHAESGAPLWPTMWPSPTTSARLSYDIDFLTLKPGQDIGAFLVSFWVYLIISMLGAFAISFYCSVNTIIYYLMRREVDATDMDDVYLEQVDDEFAEPAPAEAAAAAATSESTAPAEPSSEVNPPT